MSTEPSQSTAHSGRGEKTAGQSMRTAGDVVGTVVDETWAQTAYAADRIRAVNEQLIEAASASGRRVLDTYERTLRSMADLQLSQAESSQIDWVNAMARAQAQFMLEVSSYYTKAARDLLG